MSELTKKVSTCVNILPGKALHLKSGMIESTSNLGSARLKLRAQNRRAISVTLAF